MQYENVRFQQIQFFILSGNRNTYICEFPCSLMHKIGTCRKIHKELLHSPKLIYVVPNGMVKGCSNHLYGQETRKNIAGKFSHPFGTFFIIGNYRNFQFPA